MSDWCEARKKYCAKQGIIKTNDQPVVKRWMTPQVGEFKLNVDAAISEGASSFAIGMVIRDSAGQFVRGRNVRFAGVVSVFEAEAMRVLEALSWLYPLPNMKVIIKCDSLNTEEAICRGSSYQVEIGHIIEECRTLLVA